MGHNELEGPFYIQTGPFAGAPTLLDLQATGVGVTGGIGLQYHLTPRTTLGVGYTEQTQFDLDGNAQATVLTPFGPLDSTFDAEARLVWPRSLGVGVKHELGCCQWIGFDVIWFDWSDAFDQLDLTFSDPSNPIVGALLGSQFRDALPMRWEDTVSIRLGYEQDAWDCLTWRVGYIYHDSPAPSSTLNPYLDGVLLHTFSVGLSYYLPRGAVNASYQFMYGPERDVADSALIGDDFSNSTFSAQAHWINLSLLIPY
jgi:long-subunit fatty acid transport protein